LSHGLNPPKIKTRVVKRQGGGSYLVVGEDMRVKQILDLVGETLVGKFIGDRVRMD
jgi:hypothetical protein